MSIMRPGKSKVSTVQDFDLYQYPRLGWWNQKAGIAKGMDVGSLRWSIQDCIEAGRVIPGEQGKYHDEASIYQMELNRRGIR